MGRVYYLRSVSSCVTPFFRWSKENLPIYYAEASRILAPYTKLLTDLFQVIKHSAVRAAQHFYAFVIESKPKVHKWVSKFPFYFNLICSQV